MVMLMAAALTFLAIHLVVSGTRLRDGIVGAIGEGPYLGLYALTSLVVLIWLAISYNAASMSSENRVLYDLGRGVRDSGVLIIAVAFLLGVQGLLMPNPTSVRHGAAAAKEANIKGVLRITRHPFLWGVVIWSAFHMAANGDLASVIFFGTFFVVALLGTFSIDAKRKLVDEVQTKANAIVHVLDDVRVAVEDQRRMATAARGLAEVAIRYGVPVGFGVLTVDTMQQAVQKWWGGSFDVLVRVGDQAEPVAMAAFRGDRRAAGEDIRARDVAATNAIADLLDVSRRAVQKWVQRYNQSGVEGLRRRPGQGRHEKLSLEEKDRLCARLDAGPCEDDEVCTLRAKDVQQIVNDLIRRDIDLIKSVG
jgi:uncharacterized membrane protein/transposase